MKRRLEEGGREERRGKVRGRKVSRNEGREKWKREEKGRQG